MIFLLAERLNRTVKEINQQGVKLGANSQSNPYLGIIQNESREIIFELTRGMSLKQGELEAGMDSIAETIPLVAGSILSQPQKERMKDLCYLAKHYGLVIPERHAQYCGS